ncbi:MAG: GNAT family N-acetyltransferase [Clostridiales bacterium]|nr:GNAT family N-acetyltransferase [Clostridiales bacterium]
MIKLTTDRLIIRDHIMDDLETHHQLMSDPEIMTYIQDIQTHSFEESKQNLMYSIKESKNENRKCYFFAIVEKETQRHMGSIGFTIFEKNDTGGNCELGYFLLKEFWCKGYTTEAAEAVIDFAFNTLNMHKITTGCIAENVNSEKIMLKLDMVKEGHLRQHVLHDSIWKDRVEYALFRS